MNPILASLGRTLVGATAAYASRDRAAVEAALERASQLAGRLMDAVGGGSSMGTQIGEAAMGLYTDIEILDLDGPHEVIFESLARAIGLTIIVGQVANGPSPFARVPGTDTFDEEPPVSPISPRVIVRA